MRARRSWKVNVGWCRHCVTSPRPPASNRGGMWPRRDRSGYNAAWPARRSPSTTLFTDMRPWQTAPTRHFRETVLPECRARHATKWSTARAACARNGATCWACWPGSAIASWRSGPATRSGHGGRGRRQPAARLAVRSVALRSDPPAAVRSRSSPRSKPAWRSAHGCSMRSWPTSTARSACWPMARCRRRWSTPIPPSCGRAASPARTRRPICCSSMPPT